MNVYDEAHNLARAVKESNEYIEFHRLHNEVKEDEQFMQMLHDLQAKQFEFQTAAVSGNEPDPELMKQINGIFAMLATKPNAASYFEAEARFSMMIKDVFEILGDAVNLEI